MNICKTCKKEIQTLAVLFVTIMICTIPMSFSPIWNGTIPGHRNQYEKMAESILNGHLYLEYEDIDQRLVSMKNPYDPRAREEAGVYYHWDHAYYKGQYYMYFGIVPVFLLFLPYRILTGIASVTVLMMTELIQERWLRQQKMTVQTVRY